MESHRCAWCGWQAVCRRQGCQGVLNSCGWQGNSSDSVLAAAILSVPVDVKASEADYDDVVVGVCEDEMDDALGVWIPPTTGPWLITRSEAWDWSAWAISTIKHSLGPLQVDLQVIIAAQATSKMRNQEGSSKNPGSSRKSGEDSRKSIMSKADRAVVRKGGVLVRTRLECGCWYSACGNK